MKLKLKINFTKDFDHQLGLPQYQSEGASGFDLAANLPKQEIQLKPFERILVPTGIKMEIPKGYEIQIRPRSGLSLKTGLMIPNSPGTIDADYRGEVKIILTNISDKIEKISHGMRIAQAVLVKVEQAEITQVEVISTSSRSNKGFGSTGDNTEIHL